MQCIGIGVALGHGYKSHITKTIAQEHTLARAAQKRGLTRCACKWKRDKVAHASSAQAGSRRRGGQRQ